MSRERISRVRRSVWIVAFITAMNVMLVVVYAWMQHTSVSDGTYLAPGEPVWLEDGVIVTALQDRPDGLRTGDVVLSVDGRRVESWVEATLGCLPVVCNSENRPEWEEGQEVMYTIVRDGERLELPIRFERHPVLTAIRANWSTLVFVTAQVLIFAFVFYKRPYTPAVQVLLLSTSSLLGSMPWVIGLRVVDVIGGSGYWIHRLATEWVYLLTWFAGLHFMLIFPTPHVLVRRFRWIIPLLYLLGFIAFGVITYAAYQGAENVLLAAGRVSQGQAGLILIYLALSLLALLTNYRAQRDAVSRQQIRIIFFAACFVLALGITLWLLPQVLREEAVFSSHTMAIIGLLFPAALAVSILRYRLWDFDILINRTLVYFSLTAIIAGIYVVIVSSLGTLLQASGSHFLSLLATGVVAMSFQPLRERLQRGVNRLMYGERDDPYAVLGRLSHRLEVVVAAHSVLPIIVETIAEALKLPYVAIALRENKAFKTAAEYSRASTPQPYFEPDQVETVPLVYQSETVGQLLLAPRSQGEQFSPADMQLIEVIARQAGIAAYNVRLTQELQRSRERLVSTREEERRRLRRDLHDGLGPVLASLSFGLDAIDNLAEQDPSAIHPLVGRLKAQVQQSLTDIRRIAYNLRPPALDELGLIGALREHINATHQTDGMQIIFDAPQILPPLPAAVEVAAYRIVLEALTNVLRHAGAKRCHIRLTLGEVFYLEIIDDGCGIVDDMRVGIGMAAMRERASELGGHFAVKSLTAQGGTIVTAHLPV